MSLVKSRYQVKITKHGTIRTDATVNREIACLHHIFTKAIEWDMIERNPFDRGETLLIKENNKRVRYLTDEEITRFIPEAKKISHHYQIAMCAQHTGMRSGEILNLKWNQIRNGFVYLDKTKTKEKRKIPINKDLAEPPGKIKREKRAVS